MGVSGSERVSGPMSDQSRERGPTEEGKHLDWDSGACSVKLRSARHT